MLQKVHRPHIERGDLGHGAEAHDGRGIDDDRHRGGRRLIDRRQQLLPRDAAIEQHQRKDDADEQAGHNADLGHIKEEDDRRQRDKADRSAGGLALMPAHAALGRGKMLSPQPCLFGLAVHVPHDQHRHHDGSRQTRHKTRIGRGPQALHRNDVADLRRKGAGHGKGPHTAADDARQQVGGQVGLLKELECDGIDGEDDDKAVDAAVA